MTQRETRGAIPIAGVHRLRALEPLVHRARQLRIWSDAEAGTSTWEVELDAGHFSLMLSPEVYRGFSGEGQNLETLARGDWEKSLSHVRAQLKWQNQIDPERVANDTGLTPSDVAAALSALGARGLAGYDARLGRYFHRELPFDLDKVEELQPRLKNARALVESGAVTLLGASTEAEVVGKSATHHVRLHDDGDRCTCRWFSKHQGERGPCKHILATRLALETERA